MPILGVYFIVTSPRFLTPGLLSDAATFGGSPSPCLLSKVGKSGLGPGVAAGAFNVRLAGIIAKASLVYLVCFWSAVAMCEPLSPKIKERKKKEESCWSRSRIWWLMPIIPVPGASQED